MTRRTVIAVALVVSFGAVPGALGAVGARLRGTFAMTGRITSADGVYGEHVRQRVRHAWTFAPWCAAGPCRAVTLYRRRSSRGVLNVLVLRRRAPGVYVGHGRFWLALSCAGTVVAHGGLATEQILVRITRTEIVAGRRFATAVRARYVNPSRINLTRCPGGLGHDSARYAGRLTGPVAG
jgi:hypothetical protein